MDMLKLKEINSKLIYSIDISNGKFSNDFILFYSNYMVWSMGHYRNELDISCLFKLSEPEKSIAIELIKRNFNIFIYWTHEAVLDALYILESSDNIIEFFLIELTKSEIERNWQYFLILLSELKDNEIELDFIEKLKLVIEYGNDDDIPNLIWTCINNFPEFSDQLKVKYKNSNNKEILKAISYLP